MQPPPRKFQSPCCGDANVISVFNQAFIIYMPLQHRPVTPGWRVSRTFVQIHVQYQQPTWILAQFYVNLWVLMHWHTCKSRLNTLGRAVDGSLPSKQKAAVEFKVRQSCNARLASARRLNRWHKSVLNPLCQCRHGRTHSSTYQMRHLAISKQLACWNSIVLNNWIQYLFI